MADTLSLVFIDKVNLNHLRIFECVYRTRSMTLASQELHLTQSGVSQHVKTLEDVLGVKLFDRIKQRLVPTTQAANLFKQCSESLMGIERALSEIQSGGKQLSGTVSIGMPIEFGNNVLMPLLAQFARKNPLVTLQLRLDFASEMSDPLLEGDLDFAFVDAFDIDRRLTTESVYDEVLELCVSSEYLKSKGSAKQDRKFFESLEYVEYKKDEPVLRTWFHHHLGSRGLNLNVRATVMDVQGLARLVLSGMGCGVVPSHVISKLQKEGHKLQTFKGCGKPLKNAISVAYLKERSHSPASLALLNQLRASLNTSVKSADA